MRNGWLGDPFCCCDVSNSFSGIYHLNTTNFLDDYITNKSFTFAETRGTRSLHLTFRVANKKKISEPGVRVES